MSNTSTGQTKQVFTPEQRLALGRVYSFLIEIGRQRLTRLQATNISKPAAEDTTPNDTTDILINTE
ncbi:MAG TPA: hypothetical protein PLL95_19230 [Anaerolineales bacterium]|nr:hypothetical protein [Anaerolineales bacterium]